MMDHIPTGHVLSALETAPAITMIANIIIRVINLGLKILFDFVSCSGSGSGSGSGMISIHCDPLIS